MKAKDYGLVYIKGVARYFSDYRIIQEKYATHIEIDLPDGSTMPVYRYYSKKRGEYIEAVDTIRRYPKKEK